MAKLVGISGSLRKGSVNTALLRFAAAQLPETSSLAVTTLHGIPVYDQDMLDADGHPPAVLALKQALTEAGGLLLATPEYNHGVTGVLKNAIDWISRPASDIPGIFGGLPVAVMGAGGRSGTRFGQTSLMPTLRVLKTRPWYGSSLFIEGARDLFDDSGEFADPEMRDRARAFVLGFDAHCDALPRTT